MNYGKVHYLRGLEIGVILKRRKKEKWSNRIHFLYIRSLYKFVSQGLLKYPFLLYIYIYL